MRLGIVDGNGKIARGHEFVDDAVNGGEELLQVLRHGSFFGHAVEGGVESFGALAIGYVAIKNVKGGGAAFDDQGRGGNGNIEQSSIAVAALGFERDLFAALEALRDPVRFGGAIGWKN